MEYYLDNRQEMIEMIDIIDITEYWHDIDISFMEFYSNLFLSEAFKSAFSAATDFCLCDTDIEEYKHLDIAQKIYIYSKYFDDSLLGLASKNAFSFHATETLDNNKRGYKIDSTNNVRIRDKNNPIVRNFAKEVSKLDIRLIQTIYLGSQCDSFLTSAFFSIVQSKSKINKCKNCGLFFIPEYKINEIYCDNVFKNGKTCKQVGYENKINSDEILKAYRTAYKTQNAKKLRNRHIPDIEERFKEWHMEAKNKLADTQEGKISIDDFRAWLKQEWL